MSELSKNLNNFSRTNTQVSDFNIYSNVVNNMDNAQDLAQYRAGDDFRPFGRELTADRDLASDYLSTLVKKYGVIFQKAAMAQNPLSMFKKGMMPYGGNLQSLIYDVIAPKKFNPFYHGPQDSPYKQNLIEPDAQTYDQTEDITGEVSIIDTYDTMYFQNLSQFHDYVWNKIISLVNGAVLDEFNHTKLTLSVPISNTLLNNNEIGMPLKKIKTNSGAVDIKELAKAIKRTAKSFRYFSDKNNGSGITQATLVKDIVVIVNKDVSVDMDMEYFGQLFNPENARDFNIKYVEIDEFPSIWRYSKDHTVTADDFAKHYLDVDNYSVGDVVKQGSLARTGATDATEVMDGTKIDAVILDQDALQVWDQLPITLSSINDPKHRTTNVYLNKKSIMSYVSGLNAVALVNDDLKATKILLAGTGDKGK